MKKLLHWSAPWNYSDRSMSLGVCYEWFALLYMLFYVYVIAHHGSQSDNIIIYSVLIDNIHVYIYIYGIYTAYVSCFICF